MKILLSKAEIKKFVNRMAKKIDRDYAGKTILAVGVLKGAVIFFADLVRQLKTPVQFDFIQVKSYEGTESTGQIIFKKDLSVDIKGRDVLIIEDIIDTGQTLSLLKTELLRRGPASIKFAALFDKPSRRKTDFMGNYIGREIPDEFVVGYGLDCDEKYRNLPDLKIYQK